MYTVSMADCAHGNEGPKAKLAKLLRMQEDTDRFEFVWECLVEDGIVEEWDRGATSEEDILEDAKCLLRRYYRAREGHSSSVEQRAGERRAERKVQDISVEIAEREKDMADALRKYLAAHAARRPLVQRFRREDLPHGRLLTRDEEIAEFLAEELGVEQDVERYLDSRGGKPGIVFPFDLRAEPPTDRRYIYTDEDIKDILAHEEIDQEQQLEEDWEGPPGWHLDKLGEWLVDKYPWESVGEAIVFLISGRPPRVAEPLHVTHDVGNGTYSITYSPWVSEETVLQAYRATHASYRRPLRDKTLRILHFVLEQTDEEGRLPSWSELLDQWNAANSNERFSNRSALYKAYRRAVEVLVPPYLPLV
jgi:hypothetical protein